MVKMITFQVEDSLAMAIDNLVKNGFYSSRSEFIKESVRKAIERQLIIMDSFDKVHNASQELRDEFRKKGMKINKLSQKDKTILANNL